MPPTPLPPVTVVMDPHDDAIHTHTALAAHRPGAGRITLHPSPGTTSETALGHDLLAALGKPPLLPGRFPGGRQPAWEAAIAWIGAGPVTRLAVLRAHRLTTGRLERLLHLRALTRIHLTLVCHRPRLTAALHQTLRHLGTHITAAPHAGHPHGPHPGTYHPPGPSHSPQEPDAAGEPHNPTGEWITLPALDRLVSYDSPSPCRHPCTPPPITWQHRPPPAPLPPPAAREINRRLAAVTAHPRLAAALAVALFTHTSFQQLATARTLDYDPAAAALALHDPARYTDGCATHPVPDWARPFLAAATAFARLGPGPDQHLLAAPGDRPHLLRIAETAKLSPPQPPAHHHRAHSGGVQWDWREQREAQRYDALIAVPRRSRPRHRHAPGP